MNCLISIVILPILTASLSHFLFLSLYLSKEYTIGISNIKKINRIANEFSGGLQPSNNHRKKINSTKDFQFLFFQFFKIFFFFVPLKKKNYLFVWFWVFLKTHTKSKKHRATKKNRPNKQHSLILTTRAGHAFCWDRFTCIDRILVAID